MMRVDPTVSDHLVSITAATLVEVRGKAMQGLAPSRSGGRNDARRDAARPDAARRATGRCSLQVGDRGVLIAGLIPAEEIDAAVEDVHTVFPTGPTCTERSHLLAYGDLGASDARVDAGRRVCSKGTK